MGRAAGFSSTRRNVPVVAVELRIGSCVVPGSRKPAADLRKPDDNSASFAIAADVALVESAVCALISFSTCMFRAMFCAAVVCWRELPEMFCTRLAI